MAVAEAPELKRVCSAIFGGLEPASYPFKWLRTSNPGGSTGFPSVLLLECQARGFCVSIVCRIVWLSVQDSGWIPLLLECQGDF